ncbi:hypothetical protein CWI75_14815 [Kineobactrum sediminis]|uniref:Ice-binding protein C-terminal domain-containing protein n=1 Tax=Kineobactrum sediminis TaxID=1905677 RepID=A0A2N5XZD9_9GAMM|nr:PEP-CTERM sorting domain-containing protein [Kineobactrum sediminis]PLW81506.1 hypothetical protein CWI75_14815 [Kineobactrum sediminis]
MKYLLKPAVAATALAVTVFAGNAAAVPLSQLYFSQSAGWVDPRADGDTNTGFFGGTNTEFSMTGTEASGGAGPGPDGTYTGMQWRGAPGTTSDPNPFSQISIESYNDTESNSLYGASGTSVSDLNQEFANTGQWNAGEFWVIDELIQENNVLFGPASQFPNPLWRADTLADLRIFTNAGRTTQLLRDFPSTTRIEFWETVNTEGFDDCTPTDPYATIDDEPWGPCADRYRVGLGEFAAISEALDGYLYTISFTLFPGAVEDSAGNVITDGSGNPISTIVDVDPTGTGEFIDVYTPEIAPGFSKLYVAASWNVQKIPEPSILGLFGIGMLGLGLTAARRRKHKQS